VTKPGLRLAWRASLIVLLISSAATAGQRPTAVELDKAGWAAIRGDRLQEAADAFRDALRLEPRNVRLMLGAGLAALLLGHAEEARQQLVGALQLEPTFSAASVLLGQILYRDGDLAGAIQAYEQALVHAPGEQVLIARLDAWRRELALHDRFTQRYGDHFTVLFEGPKEEALAARVLDVLEAAYWRIGTALGAYPNGILTVVLYTNEQFRDVTRSPAWAVGAFDGRIRVPVRGALANPRELERVLVHEFTHALVYSITPRRLPQWLNEGLAELFEPGGQREARILVAQRSTMGGDSEAQDGGLIPLTRLEHTFDSLDAGRARLAYAQSVVAVQALIDRAGMPGVLNLLSYIGQGLDFPEAFERAVFVDYAEFQTSWAPGGLAWVR
jgi:peptidase MA superfamily protein/tetratricopeptide repeat protein